MQLIEKIKEFYKKRKYEQRLFIQFLMWVTVPLIIMGCVSYFIYFKGESEKSSLTLESYSAQVRENYDNVFNSIAAYYLDTVNSEIFKLLVQSEKPPLDDYLMLKSVQDILRGNYYMSDYVKTYNFINIKESWGMNNYGLLRFPDMKNRREIDEFIKEQTENPNYFYWLNRESEKSPYEELIGSGYLDISGKILVVKGSSYTKSMEYMLVIQLDFSELEEVGKTYHELGYDIAVLDHKEVLIQTNPSLTAGLLEQEKLQNGIYRGTDGEQYRVSVSDTTANGLQYVIGYDRNHQKKNAAVFLLTALIIIPVYGLLLLLIKYAAKIVSAPFHVLQNSNADQKRQIQELLVVNLLKDEMNELRIRAYFQKYNMQFCRCYRLLVIRCKTEEEERIENSVLEYLTQDIADAIFITPVIYENLIVCLIGDEDEVKLEYKAAYVFKCVKDYVDYNFQYRIAAGVSRTFYSLTRSSRAYSECMEVLNSRHKGEKDSTLALYDDYTFMNLNENAYDDSIEKELCNAVAGGNEEESRRLLELILKRMEPMGLWGIERNFYLNRLLMEILEIPVKEGLTLSDIFPEERDNVMNLTGRIYDIKELEAYVTAEIIRPIIAVLKNHEQSKATEIINQVTRMIRENRGDITLTECAEAIGYHPSYLSRTIKQKNGMNFSDMVNAEKIKIAKYMLLTTRYSVAEISESLRYNNVQNFIRFFKSQTGLTPAKFRKNTIENE